MDSCREVFYNSYCHCQVRNSGRRALQLEDPPEDGSSWFQFYSPVGESPFGSSPIQLFVENIPVMGGQQGDPMAFTFRVNTGFKRGLKDCHDARRVVICSNAIHGERAALTLMDEHQLAAPIQPVLVPAMFHGQPDGLHLPLARTQTVTRGE